MRRTPAFYQYLGAHSLLIGLLPFFLPVYLWGQGFSLVAISVLIGVSGLTFCATLGLWQITATRWPLAALIALSFALEAMLIALVLLIGDEPAAAVLLGAANGLYNAFFWTTQRTLFTQGLGDNDAGRQYGNFQLFVTAFLKLGILIGGLLLDADGLGWLLLLSTGVGALCCVWFWRTLPAEPLYLASCSPAPMTLAGSHGFRDAHGSRPVFIADGLFLFLESHFWTLSLFLVVQEDYSRLGIVVIVLALVFGLLFYLLKNTIDRFTGSRVYLVATLLYALSWVLRALLDGSESTTVLLSLLIMITFCSSLFRLVFNKRFFDHTRRQQAVSYLLVKSYLSQWWLGIGFLLVAAALALSQADYPAALTAGYVMAALLCPVYLLYRPAGAKESA